MKHRFACSIATMLLVSTTSISQVQKGSVETSASFTYGSVSTESHTTGKKIDISASSEPYRYLTAGLSVGYFVSNPLELGPDILTLEPFLITVPDDG